MMFCNKKVRNQLIMAPMTTWSGNEDLTISNQELKYYARRAKNFGVVITGTTFTIKKHQGFSNQFFAGNDDFNDSLTLLSKVIKDNGALAILQIFLPGRTVDDELAKNPEIEVVSASAIVSPREGFNTVPKALTEEEILNIINSFYDVTKRAIKCGFDGVELHGANTYLLQQFMSRSSNLRDDNWGGSEEKRLNFPKAVVNAVLKAKNELKANDFIIGYRFSPEETHQPGLLLADTYKLIDYLCTTKIDYLHISLSKYDMTSEFDNNLIIGKELLSLINLRKPLIGVGHIFTHADVKAAKDFGYNYVAIGRSAILNPDFINTDDNDIKTHVIFNNLNHPKGIIEQDLQQLDIPDDLIKHMTKGPFKTRFCI